MMHFILSGCTAVEICHSDHFAVRHACGHAHTKLNVQSLQVCNVSDVPLGEDNFGDRCSHLTFNAILCTLPLSSRYPAKVPQYFLHLAGSTDGIGKHTAERLAKLGATVLVHGRSKEKAGNAAQSIKKASGNQDVHSFAADLSSMAQVRQLASDVKAAHPKINVLSNNAGVFAERMQVSIGKIFQKWLSLQRMNA